MPMKSLLAGRKVWACSMQSHSFSLLGMEEWVYSPQEEVTSRFWSHNCNGMNEPPRAAIREMALFWHNKEGPGWEKGQGWDHAMKRGNTWMPGTRKWWTRGLKQWGTGEPGLLGCSNYTQKTSKTLKAGASVTLPLGNTWATAARSYRAPSPCGKAVLHHRKRGRVIWLPKTWSL